jgi:hypothetical protein
MKLDDKETIIGIHKYAPAYVFLLETTSTPEGFKIKEALKTAYPNQPAPIFYRIDPRQVIGVLSQGRRIIKGKENPTKEYEAKKKELEEFFRKRIKDKNARILIYDTDWSKGSSPGSILALLKNPKEFGLNEDIGCKNVKMNLSEGGDRKLDWEYMGKYYKDLDLQNYLSDSDIIEIPPIHAFHRKIIIKGEPNNYNFRGRINREKPYSPTDLSNLGYIRYIKDKGKKLGEEVKKEEQRRKSLENRVTSVITIFCLICSAFFLSPNLTGNVIINLSSRISSSIGFALLLISIVLGLLLLKNKIN